MIEDVTIMLWCFMVSALIAYIVPSIEGERRKAAVLIFGIIFLGGFLFKLHDCLEHYDFYEGIDYEALERRYGATLEETQTV